MKTRFFCCLPPAPTHWSFQEKKTLPMSLRSSIHAKDRSSGMIPFLRHFLRQRWKISGMLRLFHPPSQPNDRCIFFHRARKTGHLPRRCVPRLVCLQNVMNKNAKGRKVFSFFPLFKQFRNFPRFLPPACGHPEVPIRDRNWLSASVGL